MKILPFILAFFAFFLYLATAAPSSLWLDAPRFVAAIATLGVGNPPEPLYVLLAHPFVYLPLGSTIFKIQIFSAFTAILTLFTVYALVLRLIKLVAPAGGLKSRDGQTSQFLAGVFALSSLAFSYQFWSQAQNVENFILVAFIEALILLTLLFVNSKWGVIIGLSAVALIFGLATGTNPIIASVIPAILIVMWTRQRFITTPGIIFWFVLGTIAVVGIHLYMPWRAQMHPFLNYWDATTFERVWSLSTGEGLNVYVPELGRINGFTGSPEIFAKSSFNFLKMSVLNFHILLLFVAVGVWYLWRRSKYYFLMFTSVIATNFVFSGLYFSGNQESWFLISFVVYAILAGVGFYFLTSGGLAEIAKKFNITLNKKQQKSAIYFVLLVFVPILVLFPFMNRRDQHVTADYIENLYKPIGPPRLASGEAGPAGDAERAIIFGSSDLFDSASFYVHDVPGTPHYRPNVVPVTDNMFYIFDWYRNHLTKSVGIAMPDGSRLKYNSALEYSQFVNDFFEMNMETHKIFVTIPAMRNNFLSVYDESVPGADQVAHGSLIIDEKRFKLVPRGMVYEVVGAGSEKEPNIADFAYEFKTPGFPKKKPFMLERVYNTELAGLMNEYSYSLIGLGDYYLKRGQFAQVLEIYKGALEFSPNNIEAISRLGNYYGQTGSHDKAIEYFEKALKLEPNNPSLLFNLALAYENTGKIDKAMTRLSQVLKLTKPNSREAKLAQASLERLKTATPSSAATTSAAPINPATLPPGTVLFDNPKLHLQFIYPDNFEVKEGKNDIVSLSNGLKGKDELTLEFYASDVSEDSSIESLGENLPYEVEGIPLGSQPISLPGFEVVGKTFGSGEHLTFLVLLKQGKQGYAIKVYPGDSTKNEDFSMILGSIRVVK